MNDYVKKNLHMKEPLNRNHGNQNNLERGRLIFVADYKNGSNHQTSYWGYLTFCKKDDSMLSDVRETFRTVNIFVNKKNACFYIFGLVVTLVILLASKGGRAFPVKVSPCSSDIQLLYLLPGFFTSAG